jgi:putative aminopeptidase FrvX
MSGEGHALDVLRQIAEIPTAPFHEEAVARHLTAKLQAAGLTVRQDRFGNLLARYQRGRGARAVALVAHMDHPGLVASRVAGRDVTAEVLGGLQPGVLAAGTPVRFYDGAAAYAGTVTEYLPASAERRAAVRADVAGPVPVDSFGTLDIAALEEDHGVLALRAADDLAQCACLLLVAERLAAITAPVDVTFVLTRAEEIGLVGATLVAQAGLLARDAIVVSLECSRALPGAEIGKGPVIRVGDARQSFDPRGEALLLAARDELLRRRAEVPNGPDGPGGAVQRQLMSGGSCEASAFQAYGYITTGLVLPLGNYHNAGADGHAAPEVIHLHDLLGEVDLLLAALAESSRPLPERRDRFEALAGGASPRLLTTATGWNLGLEQVPGVTG